MTSYVDRICECANPATLPIERATTFALAINLETARAPGLTISPALPAQADDPVE